MPLRSDAARLEHVEVARDCRRDNDGKDRCRDDISPVHALRHKANGLQLLDRDLVDPRIGAICPETRSYSASLAVRTDGSKDNDEGTARAASSRFWAVKELLSNEALLGDLTVRAAVSPTWMLNWRGNIGKSAISN